jgi:hypothetical protein
MRGYAEPPIGQLAVVITTYVFFFHTVLKSTKYEAIQKVRISKMQIPFWLFLTTILFTLTWQDMASLLLKRVPTLSTTIKASLPVSVHRNILPLLNQHPNPQRPFSTTPSTMSAAGPFLEAVKNRRSVYQLKKESPISDAKIEEIVTEVLLHVPSSFNSQSSRIVILLKEEHVKLWDIAKDVLKAVVPAEQYPSTEQKLSMFQGAYGTVSPPPLTA